MFFLIGGVSERNRVLRVFTNIVCACGGLTSAELVEYYTCFHLFFLPLLKWNRRFYVISRCCGPYECPGEYAEEIMRGAKVDFSRMRKRDPNVYYDYRL